MSVNADDLSGPDIQVTLLAPEAGLLHINLRTAAHARDGMKIVHVFCIGVLALLGACSVTEEIRSALPVTKTEIILPVDSASTTHAKALLRTKQFVVAFQELETAAARGDVPSQYLLGEVYANGLGTPVSESDARRWLTAAAHASYPDAAKALAGLTVSPTRKAAGDKELARELVVWAIRHHDLGSLEAFLKVSGVDALDEFGRAPLAYAVIAGSADAVNHLLKAGAAPDHTDHFGTTALMLAAEGASDPVFKVMLTASKKLNARDSVGNTALSYAARAGRQTHVEHLVAVGVAGAPVGPKVAVVREDSGVDPTRPGVLYEGWPAVAIAVSRDDDAAVESALAAGARPDEPTPQGDTPLLVAAKYHAPKVIAPLLKAGAVPDVADPNGTTPLGYAAAHGVTDVLDALLEKGVSPDTHGPAEDPPLVRAARAGDLTAVSHLLDAGAAVNDSFPGGMTALMAAVALPSPDIFQRLMMAHPNVALRDRSGRSALWFAAGSGDDRMVDALLVAGSPIDGISPLFAAVESEHAGTLERLLRKGVPVDTRDSAGDTALIAAAGLGDANMVRALLDGGAAVDAQNSAGNTALIVATREGHLEVCKQLLKAGADAGLHNQDRIDALDTAKRRHLTDIVALLDNQ